MNCKFCGKLLNTSQYLLDGKYKSCPRCSTINGEEHVFFPYPNEFGTTEKRESINHPDGPQSYCTSHRSNKNNPIQMGGIVCSRIRQK